MRRTKALVAALTTTAGGQAALRLKAAAGAISAPGQVCLACRTGGGDPLRHTLLPVALHPDGFTCAHPDGVRWFPGDELDLLGPLGRGFHPPAHGGRWLLAAVGLPFDTQLPLLHMGLGRHAEVAVLAEAPMLLPPEVEVVNQLDLAADWADYIALAVSMEGLRQLETDTAYKALKPHAAIAEVLLLTPLACGRGVCAACALEGRRHRIRACTDGLVFPLAEVLT